MSKTAVKEPDLQDVATGEVMDGDACAARLREIAFKQRAIDAAIDRVNIEKEAVTAAKKELEEARTVVRTLEGDMADLNAGQKLMFE